MLSQPFGWNYFSTIQHLSTDISAISMRYFFSAILYLSVFILLEQLYSISMHYIYHFEGRQNPVEIKVSVLKVGLKAG